MLWDELLEQVTFYITLLCSLLHILLKDSECDCKTSENCKSLVLQDKCNIEIFLSPDASSGEKADNIHLAGRKLSSIKAMFVKFFSGILFEFFDPAGQSVSSSSRTTHLSTYYQQVQCQGHFETSSTGSWQREVSQV